MLDITKLKLENVVVSNIEGAIRGMRNPLESYHLSDSYWSNNDDNEDKEYIEEFIIGPNDLKLAMQLKKAGSDHRKFLRQIFVCFDLTMPEYFWKQYHTYKVSTVENSTSQMHTLGKRLLTYDDFLLDEKDNEVFNILVSRINSYISSWQATKNKDIWRTIIQLMPQSYLYKKTCTLTYENLINMYNARKNHKLDEWQWFIRNILKECPYSEELICN
jgi:hypothetical protein